MAVWHDSQNQILGWKLFFFLRNVSLPPFLHRRDATSYIGHGGTGQEPPEHNFVVSGKRGRSGCGALRHGRVGTGSRCLQDHHVRHVVRKYFFGVFCTAVLGFYCVVADELTHSSSLWGKDVLCARGFARARRWGRRGRRAFLSTARTPLVFMWGYSVREQRRCVRVPALTFRFILFVVVLSLSVRACFFFSPAPW